MSKGKAGYTQEGYEEYCEFIRGEGLEPASFEDWVAFNEAVTATYEDDPDIEEVGERTQEPLKPTNGV